MARYFLELSYNGSNYNGWQIQPNASSVQETLEIALSKIVTKPIKVVGCGRTDTGVNASYYVAHFDTEMTNIVDKPNFVYHLNCILPRDIAIKSCRMVDQSLHARFSATEREYKYYISRVKNPFLTQIYQYTVDLDVEAMNEAASKLLEYSDFSSFAKLHSDNKTNICDVRIAKWHREGDTLIFTITADRFLRNMVRAITGTLISVGRGKLGVDDFVKIIEAKDNSRSSSSAPAQGLFLTDITY